MGNELKRDYCPPKYCSQGSVFADSIPTLIAVVIVAFFSGNLFSASGMDLAITLVIEIIFAALLYSFTFIMFRGMKKRLAETYISVCVITVSVVFALKTDIKTVSSHCSTTRLPRLS